MDVYSTIWKFQVGTPGKTGSRCLVALPAGAHVVHVAMQQGIVTIWARCPVDPLPSVEPPASRAFLTLATGDNVPPGAIYHGTVDLHGDGALIFHVFEWPR